jgi:zinc protease
VEQVNQAFRKHIAPAQLSVVIVRDEAKAKANTAMVAKP